MPTEPRSESVQVYEALYRIGQLFNSILEPGELLGRVMDEALSTMNAERGLLMLTTGPEGDMEVAAARNIEGAIDKELSQVSRTALKEVLESREPRVFLDAPGAFPAAQSIIVSGVRSIACAPLVCKERVIGAIYLDSRTDRNVFHEDALPFLRAFAGVAALAIENARMYEALASESRELRAAAKQWQQFPEIVGRSASMKPVYEMMNRVIPTDASVLISGETGTGKELVARAIHFNGPRARQPFVPVNCGAIPANLLEAELFGFRKGAFTGAVTDKRGLFEVANSGTIFLDEVADLPVSLQPKLLRVLQNGEIRWVGDTRTVHVDVRVVSATNRNLPGMVSRGEFREDLYYRLNVIPVELPPLRRRRDDLPLLVNHFLKQSAERLGKKVEGIAGAALDRLVKHSWPGNVRELENVVERAVVLCSGSKLEVSDIMLQDPASVGAEDALLDSNASVAEIEKKVVLERLRQFNGNRTRTAASLGISRRTLLNKLAEWKKEDVEAS
ncbi:MAG: sigma-54-dependent Fis family transcriptional regulator [candidate division WOR-3 bacterium]|nr:MAG: sigma-54-dependent Fis family transcriptional regulator [candidate division WOR-3 bacterium]